MQGQGLYLLLAMTACVSGLADLAMEVGAAPQTSVRSMKCKTTGPDGRCLKPWPSVNHTVTGDAFPLTLTGHKPRTDKVGKVDKARRVRRDLLKFNPCLECGIGWGGLRDLPIFENFWITTTLKKPTRTTTTTAQTTTISKQPTTTTTSKQPITTTTTTTRTAQTTTTPKQPPPTTTTTSKQPITTTTTRTAQTTTISQQPTTTRTPKQPITTTTTTAQTTTTSKLQWTTAKQTTTQASSAALAITPTVSASVSSSFEIIAICTISALALLSTLLISALIWKLLRSRQKSQSYNVLAAYRKGHESDVTFTSKENRPSTKTYTRFPIDDE